MEFAYDLKIPKERIAVLIGKNGEVKKELEDITKTKLEVDSKEGDVHIKGEDSLKLFQIRELVKAVGRGFNPDIARQLLKQDYVLEVLTLSDYVPNKNHFERVKGRVIGANGKSRETIEDLTECYLSVYGKTVSIIGPAEQVVVAKKAVESLLTGSPHSNVYKFLEKNKARIKKEQMLNWYE